jgi:hypothetical protein
LKVAHNIQTKRPSTDKWSQALAKALAAQDILSACQWGPIQEWEKAENGLKLLFERFVFFSNSHIIFNV